MMVEESLVSLCEDYINGHSSGKTVEKITSSLLQGASDILQLIEALGTSLISTNVDVRCLATKLLSDVLKKLSNTGSLLTEDVHYLVQFYCDRLKDRAVVLPHVLTGLRSLVNDGDIRGDDVMLITRSIFKEIHCQSLPFEERHVIFSIFNSLLTHHLQVLMECSEEFVLGFIQMFDGERDPRNLLLSFSSVVIIAQNMHFDSMIGDLFDVISCYFPINFSPPPDEPMAVSKDALVQGLRCCLTATPKFAEMCLSLILEKLTSDILTAKLDSLQTLVAAIPVFGARALNPFLEQLWTAIKKENFLSSSKDIQLCCVVAVRTIAFSLSQPLSDMYLDPFVKLVMQDCLRHITELEQESMEPVVQLLCGITMASDPAAACVLSAVMPVLLHQYYVTVNITHKRTLLEAIHSFVKAAIDCDASTEDPSPLVAFKTPLLDLILSALNYHEPVYKKLACAIFSDLLHAQYVMDESEIIKYSQQLRKAALVDSSEEIREVFGSTLGFVCKLFPALARDQLIVPLIKELDAEPSIGWLVAFLSPIPSLADYILPTLIAVLLHLLMELTPCVKATLSNSPIEVATSTSPDDHSHSWEEVNIIVASVLKIVEQNAKSCPLTDATLDSLVDTCVKASQDHWKCCKCVLYKFIMSIASALSHNARHANDRWCDRSMKVIVDVVVDVSQEIPSDSSTFFCLPLLTAIIGAASPSVVSKWSEQLCGPLLSVAGCSCVHPSMLTHAAKAYASIINKCSGGEKFTQMVKTHMTCLWATLCHEELLETRSDADQHGAIISWIWLTKALVMRGHIQGQHGADRLLKLCARGDKMSAAAADGFKLILSDCTDILNEECHASVKLLYKQRLFKTLLPSMIKMISMSAKECRKQHLLKALSHFFSGVPRQVLCESLTKVLPLLLESLTSSETDVKISTLNGIHYILNDTPDSFSSYVTTLLPKLLSLATDNSSMVIRMTALQCIDRLCLLPAHTIYPHRPQVLRGLACCLDDHKRLVRRAAVDARAKWFLL